MAFTQNFNSDTFGPIQWKLMGPIADRPATADLHTTYVSTDEGAVAYAYTMPCISSSDATISFDNYYIQAQDNQLWVSRVDYFAAGGMEYTFKKYTLTPAT